MAEREFFNWLKECSENRITVCSICDGAFALGHAGLLKNTECTTHWRKVNELQTQFPQAKVVADILYVKSNNVYTSAGISAGIDLALSILEDLKGALFTHKVARGLVVYHRRSGRHKQQSIYRWSHLKLIIFRLKTMKLEQQRTRNEIIVNMSEQGYSQSAIAKAVGLRQSRISQLLNAYHESPDSFLDNRYQGKPPKLDTEMASRLEEMLEAGAEAYGFQGDVWTGGRVQLAIKETFGVSYHVHYIPRLLENMGFTLQKPQLVDSRQSPEKIEGWRSEKLPAIKKKPKKKGV